VLKNTPLFELARRFEEHAKGMVVPGTIFEEFGFNYVGPIDGHDLDSLIPTLENLRAKRGPQFLHVVTKKGRGYKLAEADPVNYHGPGKFDPAVGLVKPATPPKPSFTQVFGQWLCDMAEPTSGWWASRRPCAKARAWSSSTSAFPSATTTWALPSSMR
jgi:1-deoxy-D-xylulose-5-phosphate synthase